MKNTNLERVEKVQGDVRIEEVVVHRKKRYGYWKLKILSVLLAVLIWLVVGNVQSFRNASQGEQVSCKPAVEQTAV